ncbi:MAG: AI-2E family transporter [Actinomycetota bacterium]
MRESDRLPTNFWQWLNNSALVRFLLLFASGWAFLQLLAYFETVIVIFTIATLVAFLLSYPVRSLQRFLPRGIAVILVFLVSAVLVGSLTLTVGITLLSQGQQLIDSVTDFLNVLAPLSERLEGFFRERNLQVNLHVIEEQLRTQALRGIVSSITLLQIFFTNIITVILITVISFFMLLDGERLLFLLLKFIPQHLHRRLVRTLERNFLGFFQAQFILMLFLATASFIVFLLLNVRFALILSVLLSVFELIPGIGATLGIILVSFVVSAQNVWLALKVLVACIIVQQIKDNIIYPRIIRNSLNLNPVVIFLALLIGAKAAGLLGIFLAIPLAGVIVSWFEIEEMKGEL